MFLTQHPREVPSLGTVQDLDEVAAILATASRRFAWTKAADYLECIDSGALARRLGWLVDCVKAELPPEVRTRLLRLGGRSPKTRLGADPARAGAVEGAIGFDDTWRVFVNVTADALRGSAGLADLTEAERVLAGDQHQRERDLWERLTADRA
ncbi:MAG: hypothetical protein WCP29_19100 [Acidobacteriota bacterium]